MPKLDRRHFLAGGLAAAAVWPVLGAVRAATFDSDPFKLGVASGCPRPNGIVLWTRLLFEDAAPDILANPFKVSVPVQHPDLDVAWEIARDEAFADVVQSGIAKAEADFAHSVHVEVTGLEPGRWYFYRFRAGDAESPVGRTRTAPAADALAPFSFAFASCQQYEQGYYAALRDMAGRDLDLVVHLGDYIYEKTWGSNLVRSHGTGAPSLLFEYRDRYALYKSDPDLQQGHAAFPWLFMWDDHEVYDNYLLKADADEATRQTFRERRRAAYRAWYEHMPVPRPRGPDFADLRIYDSYRFGQLLDMALLDIREYRTPPARDLSPAADIFGAAQKQWIGETLDAAAAKWTVIGQGTLLSERDTAAGPPESYSLDGWDGYRDSRQFLIDTIRKSGAANPLVIGGDLHAFYAADVKADYEAADAPVVATEFVGGSITSDGPTDASIQTVLAENPHIKYADGHDHGYAIMRLDEKTARTDFVVVSDRKDPDATASIKQSFVVMDGHPGVVRA